MIIASTSMVCVCVIFLALLGYSSTAHGNEDSSASQIGNRFVVYSNDKVFFAPSSRHSEQVLPSNHTSRQKLGAVSGFARERFVNAQSLWAIPFDYDETGLTLVQGLKTFVKDSVITIVGDGGNRGTVIVRMSVNGEIVHTYSRTPDLRDSNWVDYFDVDDARMLDNGDIELAGFVKAGRSGQLVNRGVAAKAIMTSGNNLIQGPYRYYTRFWPNPTPPDIHSIDPFSARFCASDTVVYQIRDADQGSVDYRKRYGVGRLPGIVGDTSLIVWHRHNHIDSLVANSDNRRRGGLLAFTALNNKYVLASLFAMPNKPFAVRLTSFDSDLSVYSDCVNDSIGELFISEPINESSFWAIYWDQKFGVLVRRRVNTNCTADSPEILYRSDVQRQVFNGFVRANGNIVVGGVEMANEDGTAALFSTGREKGFAMEVTSSGQLVWHYQVGRDANQGRVGHVHELNDGSFVIEGTYDFARGFITRILPDAAMSANEVPESIQVMVSPNPSGTGEELTLRLPVGGDFSVDIVDMAGQISLRIPPTSLAANVEQRIAVPNLQPGAYMLVAKSHGQLFTTMFVRY